MKSKRRIRCIACGELVDKRRTYPTKKGPICEECWERDLRHAEKPKAKLNRLADEDHDE